jgi:hypothetical protein
MSTKVDGMRREFLGPAEIKEMTEISLPQKGAMSVAPNFRDFCEFPCDNTCQHGIISFISFISAGL